MTEANFVVQVCDASLW